MAEQKRKERARKLREQTFWVRESELAIDKLYRVLQKHGEQGLKPELGERLQAGLTRRTNRLSSQMKKRLQDKLDDQDGPQQIQVTVSGNQHYYPIESFDQIRQLISLVREQGTQHDIQITDLAIERAIEEDQIEEAIEARLVETIEHLFDKGRDNNTTRSILGRFADEAARKNFWDYIERFIDTFSAQTLRLFQPKIVERIIASFEYEDEEEEKDWERRQQIRQRLLDLLASIDENWYLTTDGLTNLDLLAYASEHFQHLLSAKEDWAKRLVHLQLYTRKDTLDVIGQYFPELYLQRENENRPSRAR